MNKQLIISIDLTNDIDESNLDSIKHTIFSKLSLHNMCIKYSEAVKLKTYIERDENDNIILEKELQ